MRLLWMSRIWPEPWSSSASVRVHQILKQLLDFGHHVVYAANAKDTLGRDKLEELDVLTVRVFGPRDLSFENFLLKEKFDAVFFDTFCVEEMYGEKVREILPSTKRVLDTVDLHFRREARVNKVFYKNDGLWSPTALREIGSIERSHQTWVVSEQERQVLVNECGIAREKIQVVTQVATQLEVPLQSRDFSEREGCVFIGNYRHEPNREAARWFVEKIWPLVHEKNPRISLKFAGAYPHPELYRYRSKDFKIKVLGSIEDHLEFLSAARISVVPLLSGAGIKGKIIESWSCGTPVITTSVGAEGMGQWSPGSVHDEARDFAEAILRIHEDQSYWDELLCSQSLQLNQNFSHAQFREGVANALLAMERSSPNESLVGQILWQEQFNTGKFRNRWEALKESQRDLLA